MNGILEYIITEYKFVQIAYACTNTKVYKSRNKVHKITPKVILLEKSMPTHLVMNHLKISRHTVDSMPISGYKRDNGYAYPYCIILLGLPKE